MVRESAKSNRIRDLKDKPLEDGAVVEVIRVGPDPVEKVVIVRHKKLDSRMERVIKSSKRIKLATS